MNAPVSHATLRDAMHGSISERAHRASIAIHCPGRDEVEMAARCDLATIRDAAIAAAPRVGQSASVMLDEIGRIATHAVFAPAPTSHLIRVKAALDFALEATRAIERVTRDG